MSTFLSNFKYAVRQLIKHPGFSTAVVVTLALCFGANLAIFAVVDSVLLRALPFPESDRLVKLFNTYPNAGVSNDMSSITNYFERRDSIPAFASLSMYRSGTAVVGEPGATSRREITRVSHEFFATLGILPMIGRVFEEAEMTYQSNNVVILDYAYWQSRFGGDPEILGKTLRLDGVQKTIVGVLPPHFQFLSSEAQCYLPLATSPENRLPERRHWGGGCELVARLAEGCSIAQAQAQIDAQNDLLEKDSPDAAMIKEAGFRSPVVSLQADHVQSIRGTLLLIQVGASVLLLIGAVNVTNLLLIRTSSQGKALAIRKALGATWRHVAGGVLTQMTVLALASGLLGLLLAMGGVKLLGVLGVEQLSLGSPIAFGGRLMLSALLASATVGIAIAVPIVWLEVKSSLTESLQTETRIATASRSAQRLRQGFVVAQISLATVLLTGAGLIGLSLQRVMQVDPGFNPENTLTGHLILSGRRYGQPAARAAFVEQLIARANSLPGVRSSGVINNIPLSGFSQKSANVTKEDVAFAPDARRASYSYGVGGDYFGAMGIPLIKGRFLGPDDDRLDTRVCVVDEAFARRHWRDGDAIGKHLFQGVKVLDDAEAFTVVGIVGSVKQATLTETTEGAVYFPFQHRPDGSIYFVMHTSQPVHLLGPALRSVVSEIDPELPIENLQTMNSQIDHSLVARRVPAVLTGTFACVAALLAAVGTYGVLGFLVVRQRREIGVRLALGAGPRQIGRQFLGLGLRYLAWGALLGGIGAWMAGSALQRFLYEVPSFHGLTFLAVIALMASVSLLACMLPSYRASRIQPSEVLRCDKS